MAILAIGALVQPLYTRVQVVIAHRFCRRKYGARQTLNAFDATLRSEVDLDQLREELIAVVRTTMQPAHVILHTTPPLVAGQSSLAVQ